MRAARTLAVLLLLASCAAGLVVLTGCSSGGAGKALYRCSMHPQVTSEKPGDCPICGMKLVPVEEGKREGAPAAEVTRYACPMHPQVTSSKPGDCPICGMHLVPEVAGTARGSEGSQDALAAVTIPPGRQLPMGLATEKVSRGPLAVRLRAPARIVPDEARLYTVTSKVDGYVEALYAPVTGQWVARGQPLLRLYSPDLVASQEEFLAALAASRKLGGSPVPSVSRGAGELVEAARRRLKLWDISDDQLARIEASGRAERTLLLHAPASGSVAEKSVVAGQKIQAGDPLLKLADLSSVWAEAELHESELASVRVGTPAVLSVTALPGTTFQARVTSLNPFLDSQTRTLRVRLGVPNPGLLLKPEMYGEAAFVLDLGERLRLPETAVLPSGEKTLVFVKLGPDRFAPRQVALGARGEGFYEVISGLSEGDEVVTSANFLVDSESSLRAALQAVSGK